jgi:threonine dehydrogenase-like Zn-dependent dehydrogenase
MQAPEPQRGEFDLVVEATGTAGGLEDAMRLVRARGTIVFKSTIASTFSVDLSPIVVKEITVVGSRCGPFDRALQALTSGTIRVRELVSERYPLQQALYALERAASHETLKVLLDIDTDAKERWDGYTG